MKLYRAFFPNASILPKMNFLEDHAIEWVKRFKTGKLYQSFLKNMFNQAFLGW